MEGWRDGGGAERGEGCAPITPLMFQLLGGKDWDKTLRDRQGNKNPWIQEGLGMWDMLQGRQQQHSLLGLGQNQSLK